MPSRFSYLSCVGEGVYRFNHMPHCDIRESMFLYSICSVVGNSVLLCVVTLVVTETPVKATRLILHQGQRRARRLYAFL